MAYAQAEQQGWDTSALLFETIGTLEGAIEALITGKADYFMWEHFTTKPIVDQGVFRRITDFPTPWSCFVIAGHLDFIDSHPKVVKTVLEIINTVTLDFKHIPSIDRTLALRYAQQLDDIQKWLSLTTWSQEQIGNEEIEYVQERLLKLGMITQTHPPGFYSSR